MRNRFSVTPTIDVNTLFEKYGPRLRRFALRRPSKDAKINLLVGSVRSGKTWALHGKIISSSANYPIQGLRVLTGQTKDTVYKNVLRDLFEIVGGPRYSYIQSSGELWLMGSQWWVMGARDEASEKLSEGLRSDWRFAMNSCSCREISFTCCFRARLLPAPGFMRAPIRINRCIG
jgi:hypothetical protein